MIRHFPVSLLHANIFFKFSYEPNSVEISWLRGLIAINYQFIWRTIEILRQLNQNGPDSFGKAADSINDLLFIVYFYARPYFLRKIKSKTNENRFIHSSK